MTYPCSVCLTIPPRLPVCFPALPPSTTNLSSWKNCETTVCLCSHTMSANQSSFSFKTTSSIHISRAVPQVHAAKPLPPYSHNKSETHLQNLQLLQPLLHRLLRLARIRLADVLSESVSCAPLGIFAEIVRGELSALAQQRAEERAGFEGGHGVWCWAMGCALVEGVCGLVLVDVCRISMTDLVFMVGLVGWVCE